MSDPPDFRLEHSELRADDEFAEFSNADLPYYADWHGSFDRLPWATDDDALAAAHADVAIVGAPFDEAVSARPGAGSARGRSGWRRPSGAPRRRGPSSWMSRPTTLLTVVDAGDAPVVPTRFERALRVIHEKVFRVASAGPIPIVLGGDHAITYPSAAAVARAVWPRRLGVVHFDAHADTGAGSVGQPLRPRHADAPPDRGGLGRREELRAGRASAATGRSRRRSRGCASRGCAGT